MARGSSGLAPQSNRFAVIDPQGSVRASLRGDEVDPEDVVRVVKRVLP